MTTFVEGVVKELVRGHQQASPLFLAFHGHKDPCLLALWEENPKDHWGKNISKDDQINKDKH